jgi:hypothetical protein
MKQRSFRWRALLFLYGNPNIVGCALALIGPALLFTGIIDRGWLLITAGLYAAGYLVAPRAPDIERGIEDSLTVQQTIDQLDEIIRRARPHLTEEMIGHLDSVRTSIVEVVPKLVGVQSRDNDWFTVRETVLRYLPETLANYVALPPAFRITQPLQGNQTARQLLGTQLSVLDTKLREIVSNVASSDAQALLANGKFLEAKFQQPDFLVR